MKKKDDSQHDQLKGTLYLVFGVGAIIIFVWAYAFSQFTGRF
jgi:hypothetical protein